MIYSALASLKPLLPSILKIASGSFLVWVVWRFIRAYVELSSVGCNGGIHSKGNRPRR